MHKIMCSSLYKPSPLNESPASGDRIVSQKTLNFLNFVTEKNTYWNKSNTVHLNEKILVLKVKYNVI